MKVEEDIKLDFKDVLIRPKRSTLNSRSEVSMSRTFKFSLPSGLMQWTGVPIVASNMDTVGNWDVAKELEKFDALTAIHKYYSVNEWKDANVLAGNLSNNLIYTMGMGKDNFAEIDKAQQILNLYPSIRFICIDVANGYTEKFVKYVSTIRGLFPHQAIIAGNVVTGDMAQELILRGADIIKVGIGPGSVCTTRIQTGVGYPQLSAIIECADAAHGLGGHIIADGGCTCPGDVAKAFGAGADFVMLGGMLAGHDEGGGTIENGKVTFYGMSSDTAMEKHHGGVAEYRSSEGRTVDIPYRGPVTKTVLDILGGLRSTCTYVGAETLKQLPKCTTFIRVNRQVNDVFLK